MQKWEYQWKWISTNIPNRKTGTISSIVPMMITTIDNEYWNKIWKCKNQNGIINHIWWQSDKGVLKSKLL